MKLTPAIAKVSERTEKASVVAMLVFGLLLIGWVAEPPVELDSAMYSGLWRSIFVELGPLITPVPGISMYPWQMLLIGLVPFCLRNPATMRQHIHEFERSILVSIACIAVTFLWGWVRGGSPYFAYYQLWRFMAGLLIAYMLMSAMRSERDLVRLGKTIILAALIRATLCIYFYWTHLYGKVHPLPEYVTDHDDSMLFAVTILIAMIWALFKRGRAAWTITALIVPVMFYAIVLNNRRLAWVELSLALPLIYFLIGAGPLRSRINRWLAVAVPVLLIYIVAGSKIDSPVFAPAHAFITTGSNSDASSLARLEEDRNLLHTLVDIGNPIMGTGWGRPYDKETSVYANYQADWILAPYTPHNSLLGLVIFSGLVGLIGIWGVVPMGAYLAARGYRGCTDLVPRAAGMVALCCLAVYSAHCYGDIGLQSLPGALIFGAALATAGKVAQWSEALPSARTAATQPEVGHPPPKWLLARRTGATPRRRYEPSWEKPGPSVGNDVSGRSTPAPMRRPRH